MRLLLLSISPGKKSGNRQRTDYLTEALRMAGYEAVMNKIARTAHPERFELVGKVAYNEVPKYFCASDVGLYPGEDHDYYHCACPIKALEYSASGAAVETIARQSVGHATVNLDTFGLKHVSGLLDDIVRKVCG